MKIKFRKQQIVSCTAIVMFWSSACKVRKSYESDLTQTSQITNSFDLSRGTEVNRGIYSARSWRHPMTRALWIILEPRRYQKIFKQDVEGIVYEPESTLFFQRACASMNAVLPTSNNHGLIAFKNAKTSMGNLQYFDLDSALGQGLAFLENSQILINRFDPLLVAKKYVNVVKGTQSKIGESNFSGVALPDRFDSAFAQMEDFELVAKVSKGMISSVTKISVGLHEVRSDKSVEDKPYGSVVPGPFNKDVLEQLTVVCVGLEDYPSPTK